MTVLWQVLTKSMSIAQKQQKEIKAKIEAAVFPNAKKGDILFDDD